MIITDGFVVINFPKTGTTFLRAAVKAVYAKQKRFPIGLLQSMKLLGSPMRELMLPKLYGHYPATMRDQHGVYRQIPPNDIFKPIVSIVRNPLTKYMSSYVFGWWREHPPFDVAEVRKSFPNFPEISFVEYYRLINHSLACGDRIVAEGARNLGGYTRSVLVFYSLDPEKAAKDLLAGKSLEEVLPSITFLHQECLKDDLKAFLMDMRFKASDLKPIDALARQNVGPEKEKNKIPLSELREVAEAVLSDDRLLLDAFPEYRRYVEAVAGGLDLAEAPSIACNGPRQLGGLR
jgi:hypothetical protein